MSLSKEAQAIYDQYNTKAEYAEYETSIETQNINNARRHSGQYTEAQLMQFGLQQALAQTAGRPPKNSGVEGNSVGTFGGKAQGNSTRVGRSFADMARGE